MHNLLTHFTYLPMVSTLLYFRARRLLRFRSVPLLAAAAAAAAAVALEPPYAYTCRTGTRTRTRTGGSGGERAIVLFIQTYHTVFSESSSQE